MSQQMGRCSPYNMAHIEAHLRSICATVAVVRINHAQCALLLRRLQFVAIMLSRLPDPTPTPQIMTLFLAANFLTQCMHCDNSWPKFLRRHFTCRTLFDAVLQRIPLVWHMHSTESWGEQEHAAVKQDEVKCAKLFLQIFGREDLIDGPIASVIQQQQHEDSLTNDSILAEEQVINVFRRQHLGEWKLPFEVLTPQLSEGDAWRNDTPVDNFAPGFLNAHRVFTTERGYSYRGISVVVRQLDSKFVETISPNTLTAFVQDVVCRSRWCHPNVVPFIGAFTERMQLPEENLSEDSKNEITPRLALGIIMEDVTRLVARPITKTSSNNNNNNGVPNVDRSMYTLHPSESSEDASSTYQSLYDLLFIQQHRFTLMEAIEITLQVADALQYILMDEPQVAAETASTWVEVSPSHVFVCSLLTQSEQLGENEEESEEETQQVDAVWEGVWEWPPKSGSESPVGCGSGIQLPLPGAFAVMYAPPLYVEHGPFSRWRPHPHAASPVCYALTQFFIALVSNAPPYKSFGQQQELATLVFDNPALRCTSPLGDDSEDDVPAVRVSIPVGCGVPSSLPLEVRNLCKLALSLRSPQKVQLRQGEHELTLEQFRESMRRVYESSAHMSYPKDDVTEEQEYYRHCYSLSDASNVGGSRGGDHRELFNSVEMVSLNKPLYDYGEF